MEPAIANGSYMAIREYGDAAPAVGDIVAFQSPTSPARDFFKRIIGLPGDEITIDETDGSIAANDKVLEESYVKGETTCAASCSWIIPTANTEESRAGCGSDACYFVLGDNRQNSSDSRQGWLVPTENIIGRVTKVHENAVVPRW